MFHIIKHYKYDVIIKLTIPLATYSKSIFVCVWNKNQNQLIKNLTFFIPYEQRQGKIDKKSSKC